MTSRSPMSASRSFEMTSRHALVRGGLAPGLAVGLEGPVLLVDRARQGVRRGAGPVALDVHFGTVVDRVGRLQLAPDPRR